MGTRHFDSSLFRSPLLGVVLLFVVNRDTENTFRRAPNHASQDKEDRLYVMQERKSPTTSTPPFVACMTNRARYAADTAEHRQERF